MARKIQFISFDGGYSALKLSEFDRIAATDPSFTEADLLKVEVLMGEQQGLLDDAQVIDNSLGITKIPADGSLSALNGSKYAFARLIKDPAGDPYGSGDPRWIVVFPCAELKAVKDTTVSVQFPAELIEFMSDNGIDVRSPSSVEDWVAQVINENLDACGVSCNYSFITTVSTKKQMNGDKGMATAHCTGVDLPGDPVDAPADGTDSDPIGDPESSTVLVDRSSNGVDGGYKPDLIIEVAPKGVDPTTVVIENKVTGETLTITGGHIPNPPDWFDSTKPEELPATMKVPDETVDSPNFRPAPAAPISETPAPVDGPIGPKPGRRSPRRVKSSAE